MRTRKASGHRVSRKKLKIFLSLLPALALVAFIMLSSGAFASNWRVETVDPANYVGLDTSLAFDANDNPFISYYDTPNRDLKSASWNGSGWTIERVDTGGRVGKDSSIDASGVISISYYDETNGDLKLARKIGSVWQTQVVDTGAQVNSVDVGEFTSLEVDANGRAHISYYNDSQDDLRYAVEVGAGNGNCGTSNAWRCLSIDWVGSVGKFTSLELDSAGKAHISYYDETNRDLKYALEVADGVTGNCDDGKWQCTVIDTPQGAPPTSVGQYSSLALDANDRAHISYYDESNTSLKYAVEIHDGSTGNCDAGNWNCQTVDSGGVGWHTSIAIDDGGPPRISYYKYSTSDLKFAIRREDGSWAKETVDAVGITGQDTSLALKSTGAACISYYGNDHLKYACIDDTPPEIHNLEPQGLTNDASAAVYAYITNDSVVDQYDVNAIAVSDIYLDTTPITDSCQSPEQRGCFELTTEPVFVAALDQYAYAFHVYPISAWGEGYHSYSFTARDAMALKSTASGSFFMDSIAPVVSEVGPAGPVSASSDVYAVYSDAGSGVDTSSVNMTLDGNPLQGCTVTDTNASCSVYGLDYGEHVIGGSVTDNAGNISPISGSFVLLPPSDDTPPVILSVQPSGTITSTSAAVEVYYDDDPSGVNPSSVMITLDGNAMEGCTVTSTNASCSAYDLSFGTHLIGGSVEDYFGNAAPISGSFYVAQAPPPPGLGSSPHGGYSTSASARRTDYCLACHDVHGTVGDYMLMREASVTETCATCHNLFGATAPGPVDVYTELDWVDGTNATASQYSAYENTGAARVSGHRLGVELNGETGRQSDTIPRSSMGLRVVKSPEYYEPNETESHYLPYDYDPVTDYSATNGLYCASCHTPHGSIVGDDNIKQDCSPGSDGVEDSVSAQYGWGDQLVTQDCGADWPQRVKANRLLSSNPNHKFDRVWTDANGNGSIDMGEVAVDGAVSSYNGFCIACHDLQDDGTWHLDENGNLVQTDPGGPGVHNHPPLCIVCHSTAGGSKTPATSKDYPHTSSNQKLMQYDHDGSCTGCHNQTNGLP